MPRRETERFSTLIARIYDCALDPALWPAAMESICRELGFAASTILLGDYRETRVEYLASWNAAPEYQRLMREKFAPLSLSMFKAYTADQASIDEPLVLSRGPMDKAQWHRTPMYLEWAKPQGYGDTINLTVLRHPHRIGALAMAQLEMNGDISDEQIAGMRLLAPHLRRAVTIGDVLNLSRIEAQTLSDALDNLTVGVVLVDATGSILHANAIAERMLRDGRPVHTRHGRISTSEPLQAADLLRAISLAATEEAMLGATGIGIRVSRDDEAPAIAHVLPLGGGASRMRLFNGAGAAIFVTSAAGELPRGVEALRQAFGLTEAEAAILEQLASGRSLDETAEQLGIARTTAKSQLMRVFAKTGVSRQSDLIHLAMTLVPPVRRP